MSMVERSPSREQIADFANKHGIPKRIAKLILRINSPSAARCDEAAASYLKAESDRLAGRASRSPEFNTSLAPD
jgi:hypothetical protein